MLGVPVLNDAVVDVGSAGTGVLVGTGVTVGGTGVSVGSACAPPQPAINSATIAKPIVFRRALLLPIVSLDHAAAERGIRLQSAPNWRRSTKEALFGRLTSLNRTSEHLGQY